ncbi:MAG: IS1/IS1595 family N-terminal zinc-binding domain-containing protein [Pyrinomonadaceae bacterium]
MDCPKCSKPSKRFGKDRKGQQRFRCLSCGTTFTEPKIKMLDNMILAEGKALSVLSHLVEGCSIRSTERLTGVHRDTILDLLALAGRKCESLMDATIKDVPVEDVECDEVWSYIGMKAKTKAKKVTAENDDSIGDAWTFTAIERHSKLILAWHLGQRDFTNTAIFTEKIDRATKGSHFQITTDGFAPYRDAIGFILGGRTDFAQLIKIYANNPENETRYSPAQCTGCKKKVIHGRPDPERVGTSRIERHNLSVRMETRRFTRLTNAFSKKWEKHHAALALYFAYYNFCRMHKSLRCTPAMAAGITKHIWTLKDLLLAATEL